MEYNTPKDLSEKYWKSLKTIYNWLQRHSDKIRTKTEFWKTIVNCNDFEKVFQNYNPNYKIVTKEPPKQKEEAENTKSETHFVKLQNEYNYSIQKIEDLKKHNSTLSNQIKEYVLLFKEEKTEKKELQDKLELLNGKYTQKIEDFGMERIKMTKKQYVFIGFSVFFGLIIIWLQFWQIVSFFWAIFKNFS